jgi:hypothetical protein
MARTAGVTIAEIEEVAVSQMPGAFPSQPTDWGAIIGGALAAIGLTLILFTAGSGFGLSSVSPWTFANQPPENFAIVAGIWIIVMQWLSSALGGYMAGRLRTRWVGARTDEVMFRDTAHGFLAWALATLAVAILFASGATLTGAAATAVTGAPAEAAQQITAQAAEQAREIAANFSIFTAVSLLVGAFIGAAAGALGGFHRDA